MLPNRGFFRLNWATNFSNTRQGNFLPQLTIVKGRKYQLVLLGLRSWVFCFSQVSCVENSYAVSLFYIQQNLLFIMANPGQTEKPHDLTSHHGLFSLILEYSLVSQTPNGNTDARPSHTRCERLNRRNVLRPSTAAFFDFHLSRRHKDTSATWSLHDFIIIYLS